MSTTWWCKRHGLLCLLNALYSGEHECLHQVEWQSIQFLARNVSLISLKTPDTLKLTKNNSFLYSSKLLVENKSQSV